MAKLVDSLSFFYPCYNEEEVIEKSVGDVLKVLPKISDKYELILIDDGSKDRTGEIADDLARKNKFIKVVHHKPNQGYGGALKSGFYNSKYSWIATCDSDGQFDVSELSKLINKANEGYDVVIGYRIDRKDPFIRKVYGAIWTTISNVLLGISVRDVDCSFKLVKKDVIDKIPRLESSRGAMISPELLGKARKAGFKIYSNVGVHHFPREKGHNTGADLMVKINSFLDLFKLWWKLNV